MKMFCFLYRKNKLFRACLKTPRQKNKTFLFSHNCPERQYRKAHCLMSRFTPHLFISNVLSPLRTVSVRGETPFSLIASNAKGGFKSQMQLFGLGLLIG